jgi:hypothetical protein
LAAGRDRDGGRPAAVLIGVPAVPVAVSIGMTFPVKTPKFTA